MPENGSFYTPYGAAAMVINLIFFSCLATMEVTMRQLFDKTSE